MKLNTKTESSPKIVLSISGEKDEKKNEKMLISEEKDEKKKNIL